MNNETTLRTGDSDRTRLEKIAADAQRPMEIVEQLYLTALTVLDQEARIQAFVPVIALRRVKDALRNDARAAQGKRA
jgi:Protein of unknown function (DUF3562)